MASQPRMRADFTCVASRCSGSVQHRHDRRQHDDVAQIRRHHRRQGRGRAQRRADASEPGWHDPRPDHRRAERSPALSPAPEVTVRQRPADLQMAGVCKIVSDGANPSTVRRAVLALDWAARCCPDSSSSVLSSASQCPIFAKTWNGVAGQWLTFG